MNFFFDFVEGNETFEKLASMSLIANLVLYLHTMYNLDSVDSAYVFQIWSGTTNFAALAGAFLADAYLGRFYTLLFGSFASLLVLFFFSSTPLHQIYIFTFQNSWVFLIWLLKSFSDCMVS